MARLRPVSTTARTRAAVKYWLVAPSNSSSVLLFFVAAVSIPVSLDSCASVKALVSGLDS
ncbi:hypothetical protein D3C85_1933450 [compost metagenome]